MLKNAVYDEDGSGMESASDTTEIIEIGSSILSSAPAGVYITYFDQNTGLTTPDFVYSKTGKSYLKPLNTRFLYVYSNNSDVTLSVMYGNTKQANYLHSGSLLSLALLYGLLQLFY
ncbi:hypothetical protein FGO68_gene11109 [Halteria grandinella]|uniref:Uncharacterized protein n=1 Tax=Halteria grandinella TaxID=5974 RepID=A0A8J8NJ92_HALGN|nr:hypothetical protein FGO68_gene11109 [Halteria grandinella]